MPQHRPRGALAVSAFVGGVLSAGSASVLLEIAVENGDWWPTRIAAALAAAAVAVGGTGFVARRSAERARDARDARLDGASYQRGDQVDAVPLGVQTTRELPTNEGPEFSASQVNTPRSVLVRLAVLKDRTEPYSTYAQRDTTGEELAEVGRYRVGVHEIDVGDRGVSLRESNDYPNPPATPAIRPGRRFRGIARIRTAALTPIVAFAVGFGAAGYAVHEYLPDTSGISTALLDALEGSSDDEVSGNAEEAVRDALEDAEDESSGASQRLTYLQVYADSTVSLKYYEPDIGKEISIYDEGEPTEGSDINSQGTFALSIDDLPPLNAMRDEAFGYFADPWYFEIAPPDEETLLPDNHVEGEPIAIFYNSGPDSRYNEIEGTLDGNLARFFDTTNIAETRFTLSDVLTDIGLDPDAPAFESFGASGPIGGVGYAPGISAPGQVLFATFGPGAGELSPGEVSVAAGQFPRFSADDHEWAPDEVAALIPLSSMSPAVLSATFDKQATDLDAETADLLSYVYRVDAPELYSDGDPALLTLSFTMLAESAQKYTLNGTPYGGN
ncbi:hypothetical protein [Cumulibacter soli]|uniref:hypothetical protein n=1 Tax=Cumulibacter soli TaxID=2546344 RepID=UPI00106883ED|nr:hypothetical protein [Cumulibacter soli]